MTIDNQPDRLALRSRAAVWHPCTQMKHHEVTPLVAIARGHGVWLYDCDGKRYLDAIGSWWVNLFGHGNSRISSAIAEQLEQLEHVMLAGFTHEPVVTLSERLSELTNHQLGHCFYASDGACAVEIVLKMSVQYWRARGWPDKTRFVSLANGYHGETIGALGVTDLTLFRDHYLSLLQESAKVPSPDWRLAQAGESPRAYAERCAHALESHLEQHHVQIAALIVEPLIQGAAGMGMYDAHYLRIARELCDRYEVHLISDEIMTGCGRTGTFFAYEQAGIVPDFLCLSKGISGGYLPLSVAMTSDDIYGAFYADDLDRGFLHSHSYSGNALACRAAVATLDIFAQDNVLAVNRVTSSYVTRAARSIAQHPRVKNFRNIGMIWAFEVDAAEPGWARKFSLAAMRREVLLRPLGNTVYFIPPYVISESEIDFLVAKTLDCLEETVGKL